MKRFSVQHISDQKRLVRGEHLLLARTILRARDQVHHRKWRVLMVAGNAPQGEVTAIRELMATAYVVAVDRDQSCVAAAVAAGVDKALCCDLTAWAEPHSTRPYRPPTLLADNGPFDLMILDLCGGVLSETTRDVFRYYPTLLTRGGVCLMTFSYGRDVVEVFAQHALKATWEMQRLRALKVPTVLAGRLAFLFKASAINRFVSIMAYRGHEMPMCSIAYCQSDISSRTRFVRVEPGDFELAVTCPDPSKLYDCPADRIAALRRTNAAIRASFTRQQTRQPKKSAPIIDQWELFDPNHKPRKSAPGDSQ